MASTVVVTNRVHDEVIAYLESHATVIANNDDLPWDRATLRANCSKADAMLAFMTDIVDDAFLNDCPSVRMVACALKGYDNFDVAACTLRGVTVSIVPDLLTEPTAELAIGLIVALGRRLLDGDRLIRTGSFQGWRPILYGRGLSGSRVGILGVGVVGRAIARRLRCFGADLYYYDNSGPIAEEHELGLTFLELEELLRSSHYVVLAVPLNPTSRHLICRETLALMRRDALLVNVGRGSVVDERAVAEALTLGRLGGYAADVFEMEDWALADRPKGIDQRLIDLRDRTVFSPHLGSAVDDVRREIELSAARNIVQFLAGDLPVNALNTTERASRFGS
ncbi:MAG: hydroxyacid dehydrogenase [Alphaproteobacteria bacterium 65-37]|jgi:phosphonate dehydrogenase|uniref:NAD(P)-dependent oxidoreductase n=1 Tax=uncultured Reyranella sp. TaxID=735512 RepID=UPI000966A288|nr:NAD(P)-dependent oxidoreductase [uncultured Reyranella sp.]OJU35010.1 MAG: hydroxyacid dehydrogenase [Alphaproteobacteria bacterium 65-37]